MSLKNGFVQVYTGNGKGKTTAALGLALRAAGAEMRVFIGQFAKGQNYSELNSIRTLLPAITIEQFGAPGFICGKPTPREIGMAGEGLQACRAAMLSGSYDLVILDEANVATDLKLIAVDSLLELIERKPPQVELVITGRNADPQILDRADLVTEMREVKHYYANGVAARRGIEA